MNGLPFAFLNPLALLGLFALPLLWFILRFLPPVPKQVFLPTARFLIGLQEKNTTPQTTPWWLLLLRFLILFFLILGFSNPVFNPQKPMDGAGPVRLIFDNGWASAQNWDLQISKARDILEAAQKSDRMVELVPTASAFTPGFMRAGEALSVLKSLKPQPWPGQFRQLMISDEAAQNFWISSGLSEDGLQKFAMRLSDRSELTVFVPDMKTRPGILRPTLSGTENSLLNVELLPGSGRALTLQGYNDSNRLQGQLNLNLSGQRGGEEIIDEGGIFTGKAVSRWKIAEMNGTGGIYLSPQTGGSRLIGVVASGPEAQRQDFTDAVFYLSRATEIFAKLETGSIENLMEKNSGVIVLPDIATFTPEDLERLEDWVSRGGILLRFGGNRMSEAENVLIPVPLKNGLRSLSGDLNWGAALKLGTFPKTSPFAGMAIPDITVERQLLAEPSPDLQDHVWAQLSDNTPFITARAQGRGLIVLVHTTATPDWSDFVLSGFYVSFLKEVAEMSALSDKSANISQTLQPHLMLDGWASLVQPGESVKSIEKKNLTTTEVSPAYPPGLYANEMQKYARNLGDTLPPLEMIENLPGDIKTESLSHLSDEENLKPFLLAASLTLFLIDWIIRIFALRGNIAVLIVAGWLLLGTPAQAQSQADSDRASSIHLACVKTSKDDICLAGLNRLSLVLKERTSAEMGEAIIVDLEKDDLSFYPLLYWPVEPSQNLSPKAVANLGAYLRKGGMALIDTQDGAMDNLSFISSPSLSALRDDFNAMNIPLLKPADKNHVIFRSFYLLNQRSEYDLSNRLWVEEDSIPPQEGLSSVILTGGDWMRLWAYAADPLDEEMSYRFGVNLALYALTGNYKADQVHMNTILERLGE